MIQLGGGWDGLNVVVPYTDSRYKALRPTISFTEAELKDETGASTILGNHPFGLNPAMGELKSMYDAGKVGIVLGVGYPSQNLSHFFATDIWQTANTTGAGNGWLGRYADQNLVGKSGLSAVSIGGGGLPKGVLCRQRRGPQHRSGRRRGPLCQLHVPNGRSDSRETRTIK